MRAFRLCVVSLIVWGGLLVARAATAATFVVDDAGDASDAVAGNGACATAGGVCTLRAAIQEANALAGPDTIVFAIGGGGLRTIAPASVLPTIATEIDIDGTTQPGFVGTPLIKIVGTGAVDSNGIVITGANSSLRGLIIVGFPRTGVQVDADGVVVAGNYIGVTETGAAQGNGVSFGTGGVVVGLGGDYPNTIVGGTTPSERNVISGNGYGVQLLCVSNVRVQGNYIGLDPTGLLARPNLVSGVLVTTYEPGFGYCGASGDNNVIGGDVAGAGNVVSGNTADGIVIGIRGGGTLSGNRVQGNLVGLAADGTTVVPNGPASGGILVSGAYLGVGAATNTLIGGTTAEARNVIAGDGVHGHGIRVEAGAAGAPSPAGTTIRGNYVGLDVSGTVARGLTTGIYAAGPGTVIGGTAAGARNVVAGSASHNILVENSGATIQGNYVGTNAAGTAAVNSGTSFGVLVKAPNTLVGGTTPEARNVISGNYNGLYLSGNSQVAVTNVTVHGNYIGTDPTGLTAVPNAGSGVVVDAPGFTIGGTGAGMGNLVSGNTLAGIYLLQTSWGTVSGVSILGNRVGVDAAGNPLGNGGHGVRVDSGVSGTVVGGTNAGEANVIANSGSRGVLLIGGTGIVVRGNRLDANGSLGIDILDTPGVDSNDALDADTGTNGQQNFPVVLASTILPGSVLEVQGTLHSTPATTFTIDAYANAACDALNNGEGDVYVGSHQVTTDAGGNATFQFLAAGVPGKLVITTTATGPEGTSEFSQCRTAVVPSVTISGHVRQGSGPGAFALAGVTVTLSGSASASTITTATGSYQFAGLATGGSYAIAPSLGGFVFTPPSRALAGVTTDQSGQDFAGSQPSISGTVTRNGSPLQGVTVTLSGAIAGATTTDAAGQYAFSALPAGGSFTVTPSLAGFVFVAPSASFDNLVADQVANFTATRLYTISGQVRDLNDTGVAGVTLTLSGSSSGTQTSGLDGRYGFTVPEGGTYTVTPSKGTFTFNPQSQTFATLQGDREASFFVAEVGTFTRYFAEGATGPLFDTGIALLNATGRPSTATVKFLTPSGHVVSSAVSLNGLARATVNPETLPGLEDTALAVVIESDQPLIADRTMRWDSRGYGAHAETSIARPLTRWYLAEGATSAGFNLFYLVQNPNAEAAQVEVKYLLPAPRAPIVKVYEVGPSSRADIWVNFEAPELASVEVSAVVTSLNDVPIIVERAMYFDRQGRLFDAGHESAAAPGLSTEWFLAEGATGPFFDLFVLVANPNAQDAELEVTYLLVGGETITRSYTAAADSRLTIWVDLEEPPLDSAAVSTVVRSTNAVPVLVERAMWWPGTAAEWHEGHNSSGAVQTGEKWGLAEGEVGGPLGLETYVLIANTSPAAGVVRVTLIFEDGTQAVRDYQVPASSRTSVAVGLDFPAASGRRFGAIVESQGPAPPQIVVERAMYNDAVLDGRRVFWAAGTNSLGTRLR